MTEAEGATVVLTGGTVRVDETRVVDALGIHDGRVVVAGEVEEVLQACPDAEQVDVSGLVVAPGLVDTHPHALHFAAFAAPTVDVSDARDHADIVDAIRRQAARTPPGEWVMTTPVGEPHYFIGRTWRDLAEGVLPDAVTLDAGTRDHPVMVQAWAPNLPNHAAVNTAALAVLGIGLDTPSHRGNVVVEKDNHGWPTGRLRGAVNNYYNLNHDDFWAAKWAQIPFVRPALVPGAVREAIAAQNALGVTTIYEGHAMEPEHIAVYRTLAQEGALTVRVLAASEVLGAALQVGSADAATLRDQLTRAKAIEGDYGDFLRVDGFTIKPAGPFSNGKMVMREPYIGPFGERTTGEWHTSPTLLGTALRQAASEGLRVNLCASGLGEHDVILRILDDMRAEGSIDGSERWILQHAYFLDEPQATRYAGHGLQVTVSIGFTTGKGARIRQRMGEHVMGHLNAFRRMIDSGLTVAGSSDWGPKNPFECIALATTHRIGAGPSRNDGPAQVASRREAYAMWGRRAAEVLGWRGVGDLRPGSHADLVLLDRDPVTCALDDLPDTRVVATLVAGRTVTGRLPGSPCSG